MDNLKQKYIENLDRVLKKLLEQDVMMCNAHARDPCEVNSIGVNIIKTQIETLLLFSNVVLGRVQVNKLCRKYKINNTDHGGI